MENTATRKPPFDLLVAPVAVDFQDSTGNLFNGASYPAEAALIAPPDEQTVVKNAMQTILQLKRDRPNHSIAYDVQDISTAQVLRADRQHALNLALRMTNDAATIHKADAAMYGFADIMTYPQEEESDIIHRSHHRGVELLVRAEELLAPKASVIVDSVTEQLRGRTSPESALHHSAGDYWLKEQSVIYTTKQGDTTTIPLRGYEYNRSGHDADHERQTFPDFPSCEIFIATATLEQQALAGNVIRLVSSGVKREEKAARALLQLLDYTDLPVLSCALTSTGEIQKIISWGKSPSPYRELCKQYSR